MGGVLILFSMTISLLLWMDLTNVFTWIFSWTSVLSRASLGGIDDYFKLRFNNSKGLKARRKMAVPAQSFRQRSRLYLFVPPVTEFFSGQNKFRAPTAKEQVGLTAKGRPIRRDALHQEYIARLYVPFFKEPVVIFHVLVETADVPLSF